MNVPHVDRFPLLGVFGAHLQLECSGLGDFDPAEIDRLKLGPVAGTRDGGLELAAGNFDGKVDALVHGRAVGG